MSNVVNLKDAGARAGARPGSNSEPLLRTSADGITTLTLNRPTRANALSRDLIAQLTDAFSSLGADPETRVIVLAATGAAFCAGHDLKELTGRRDDADRGRAFFSDTMTACAALMQAIVSCPKPVVAAVHSTATAAGCQLVATCDLAVAAESAGFCTPGVDIGLFCSTPMVALSRNVAAKHAMEMLLTGEMVSADTAREIGLVNRVVPDGDVLNEAQELAAKIARKPSATVATGKAAFYRQRELPLADAYMYAAEVMVENMLHADACEGIGAFLERRPPSWERAAADTDEHDDASDGASDVAPTPDDPRD
ncbi:MAG: enoyl-CoA hydratase [Pseudomonadota bacterium]